MEKQEVKAELKKIQNEIKVLLDDWKYNCTIDDVKNIVDKLTPELGLNCSSILRAMANSLDHKWWQLNAQDNKYPHIPEEWLSLSGEELIEQINNRYSYKQDGRILYKRWIEYDYPSGSKSGKIWFRESGNAGHHNMCWTEDGEPLKELVCFFYESFLKKEQAVRDFWD